MENIFDAVDYCFLIEEEAFIFIANMQVTMIFQFVRTDS